MVDEQSPIGKVCEPASFVALVIVRNLFALFREFPFAWAIAGNSASLFDQDAIASAVTYLAQVGESIGSMDKKEHVHDELLIRHAFETLNLRQECVVERGVDQWRTFPGLR